MAVMVRGVCAVGRKNHANTKHNPTKIAATTNSPKIRLRPTLYTSLSVRKTMMMHNWFARQRVISALQGAQIHQYIYCNNCAQNKTRETTPVSPRRSVTRAVSFAPANQYTHWQLNGNDCALRETLTQAAAIIIQSNFR
jgi:hypothetical protein